MSVNGVAINVGQRWKTRGSHVVDISRLEDTVSNRWLARCTDGRLWSVTNHGSYVSPSYAESSEYNDRQYDLVELISVTDAMKAPTPDDPNTKATNPKDAIGDRKVPLWLCSAIAMAHWAAAQFAGLTKYGAWNWRSAGVRSSTYISAIKRHVARWENGERCDPVDGTHHLGNIMACAAILLEAEAIGKLNDDRSPRADLQPVFDEVEAMMVRLKEMYADKAPKHWTINDTIEP